MLAPAELDVLGVKVTPQLAVGEDPARKVQLVALKIPATPLVKVKVTDPVGVVAPTDVVSVTVAVQVDCWLTTTGPEQDRLVLVECCPG